MPNFGDFDSKTATLSQKLIKKIAIFHKSLAEVAKMAMDPMVRTRDPRLEALCIGCFAETSFFLSTKKFKKEFNREREKCK
jgi:hypothetical protein